MLDRWRELDLGQRRALATLGAVVLAVALVSGLVAVTRSDGGHVALTTDQSSTSSTEVTTTSSTMSTSVDSSVTVTADPSAPGTVDTTGTTQANGSTTVMAKGGSRVTVTTRAPGTTRATTGTTQAPVTTTNSTGPCNTGGGTAAANRIATLFCSHRTSLGLPTMTRNGSLDQLAQQWAEKMASDADAAVAAGRNPIEALNHNPDYQSGVLAGCSRCNGWAENVAYNTTADLAWSGWLESTTGHRENIENPHAGEYGVGAASGGGYIWFTQDFGRYPG
jgi:uncharacterized protein YkwD